MPRGPRQPRRCSSRRSSATRTRSCTFSSRSSCGGPTSRSLTYWFFWTCESAAGWRATLAQLDGAEQKESTSWLRTPDDPLLWARVGGGVRKVVEGDFFFKGTPVRILRVAIGVVKEDEQEMECEGCRLTQRTLGFARNKKKGGAPTRRKNGNIHGLSVFVVPDSEALGLVLGEQLAGVIATGDGCAWCLWVLGGNPTTRSSMEIPSL